MDQLLVNYNFSEGSTGWTASGGFGSYSYTSSNQIAILDGIVYFTYVSRTLSQIVNVSSLVSDVSLFVCVLNIKHKQKGDDGGYTQVDSYSFELIFKDESNNIIINKRTPVSGSAAAPQNFTDIELSLNRSEIANFNDIHSIEVKITGLDVGYWNGNHGPMVDYVSLHSGLEEQTTPTYTPTYTPTHTPTYTSIPASKSVLSRINQNHNKLNSGVYKRFWNIFRRIRED